MRASHHTRRGDREPFGAVTAGTQVRVTLWADEQTDRAVLRLWQGRKETRVSMLTTKATRDGLRAWTATIDTRGEPRLIWYWFEGYDASGERLYFLGQDERQRGGEGRMAAGQPPSFQLTNLLKLFARRTEGRLLNSKEKQHINLFKKINYWRNQNEKK
jgi:hypothetical protein